MQNEILLIEDSVEMQELLKLLLEQEGYLVQSATTGAQALSVLRKKADYMLILLDLTLPDMSADSFLLRFKEEEIDKRAPIVFFSAVPRLRQMKLPDGVVGVIQKPFQVHEFLEVIEQFKNSSRTRQIKPPVEQNRHA